jgi:transcriptional regulator with PAS, ATPase and Fis domain
MLDLFEDIRRAARADVNVLILGKTGSGKDLVARRIHAQSARHAGPFLAVNCAAIPETLLDSELFGYERGAFTGADSSKEGLLEGANRGTMFLDEFCELNPSLQAKLLRALEEGGARRLGGRRLIPFDVRVVAATNRDVREQMKVGRLREDLFFRLDVIEINVPPLRERRHDIPLLARHFLAACVERCHRAIEAIAPEAMDALTSYDWPGNVRELKNAIERAAAYAQGRVITVDDLPATIVMSPTPPEGNTWQAWRDITVGRLEKEYITTVLADHGGNVSHAAKALDLHRSTLQRLMRKHGVGCGDIGNDAARARHHESCGTLE